MVRIYNLGTPQNTRLYITYSLVFFLLVMLVTCRHQDDKIKLVWSNNRAIGISIPKRLIKDVATAPGRGQLKIVLSNNHNSNGILGDFEINGNDIVFKPLVPLSPGLKYDILQGNQLIGNIMVPVNTGDPPKLIAIYPEADTLPENLLKFYFRFSKSMQTGQALDHIYLLDRNQDTMRNVFLNLQPELWDTSGTVLTLWLDPGRIKRDLVLNRKLGNPLKNAQRYQLIISRNWKDNRGVSLAKNYVKQFVTGARDGQVPNIDNWQLNIPEADTKAPLVINIKEPLDHYLLPESITVTDSVGRMIKGTSAVKYKDVVWEFIPSSPWVAQPYKLQVKANLEDLCGNNLNHLFDRDITKDRQQNNTYDQLKFEVKQ